MKSKDKKIFTQAFDELSQEGYFEDFVERVNRLQPASEVKSKVAHDARCRVTKPHTVPDKVCAKR